MGARRIGIGTSHTTSAFLEPLSHDLHNIFHRGHHCFCQTDDIDFLLAIFTAVQKHSLVEQVVQLATVNLIKADLKHKIWVAVQQVDYVEGGQEVQARHLPIVRSHHRESFT